MSKKLVIVESPAKAKTISRFLGSEYVVEASIGHIRDLPVNASALPKELRGKWWADYAVDVENDFQPFYEVPNDKRAQVEKLRKAMKGADTLVLATDEDREGESISWHLLQVLQPGPSVKVIRIAFHEITKEAILEALRNPREIDLQLVEAQETRRILDRLYGYTLSPVLWNRLERDLSAGRVQSPTVKLIVEREIQRRDFRTASYWDLTATLRAGKESFETRLKKVDSQTVASGKDFDDNTGQLVNPDVLLLDEATASDIARRCEPARPWTVSKLERTPGTERPPAPFMTTTLQQEANRKLRFGADQTMRIAQSLYEGVDVDGDRVGLITYMRTDSLNLADDAVREAREVIKDLYGADYLPAKPAIYRSKVRNAQEAHEAIRPTAIGRRPETLRGALTSDQLALYELIWKRTVACQMKPAEVLRTFVDVVVKTDRETVLFGASGKQIKFPGFLKAYVEGADDPDAELEGRERLLPDLKEGQEVEPIEVLPDGHATRPPARFTEASLIKRLEELGIGRPSTYASIISVIQNRGYVRKSGKELIPTFTAFLAMELLGGHFGEFLELDFTAEMDDDLDEIANGKFDSQQYLRRFFYGDDSHPGLRPAVEERRKSLPYPAMRIGDDPGTGEAIVLRRGKNGFFLQLGSPDRKQTSNVPEDIAPADLTVERALELLSGPPVVGTATNGNPVTLKQGPYGRYLEVAAQAEDKPKRVTIPDALERTALTESLLHQLLTLPRPLGNHPDTGETITVAVSRFGGYIKCGPKNANLEPWQRAFDLTQEEAIGLLSQDKEAGRPQRAAATVLKELEDVPNAAGPVRVLSGRYGPYVTDGATNATLPKDLAPESLTADVAAQLLDAKRAAGPSTARKGWRTKGKAGTKSKSATKAKSTTTRRAPKKSG